jgi:hypothetical protein
LEFSNLFSKEKKKKKSKSKKKSNPLLTLYEEKEEEEELTSITDVFTQSRSYFNLFSSHETKCYPIESSIDRIHFACCQDEDEIYIHGGIRGNEILNDLRSFNTKEQQWYSYQFKFQKDEQFSPKMAHHSMFILPNIGAIILMNGSTTYYQLDNYKSYNRCWKKRNIKDYKVISSAPFSSITQVKNQFYFFGGNGKNESSMIIFHYNEKSDQLDFLLESDMKHACPKGICSALVGRKIYFFGEKEFFHFDMQDLSFQEEIQLNNPPSLFNSSMFSDFSNLYISGGISEKGISNETFHYNLERCEWKVLQNGFKLPIYGHKIFKSSVQFPGDTTAAFLSIGGISDTQKYCECFIIRNLSSFETENKLIKHVNRIRAREEFQNIKFIIEGIDILENREFLSMRCDYLKDKIDTCKEDNIQILDCSYESFKNYINFLYTLEIDSKQFSKKDFQEIVGKSKNFELFSKFKEENSLISSSFAFNHFRKDFEFLFEKNSGDLQIGTFDSEETFQVHKFMISRSLYLNQMFSVEMKELKEKKIQLKNISHETLKFILKYLYLNQIDEIPSEYAVDLLLNAVLFDLPELKIHAERIIESNISLENVFELISIAEIYGLEKLSRSCVIFCCSNFEMLEETKISNSLRLEYCQFYKFKNKIKPSKQLK